MDVREEADSPGLKLLNKRSTLVDKLNLGPTPGTKAHQEKMQLDMAKTNSLLIDRFVAEHEIKAVNTNDQRTLNQIEEITKERLKKTSQKLNFIENAKKPSMEMSKLG